MMRRRLFSRTLVLTLGGAALAACQQRETNVAANQDLSMEDNLATGQVPPNTQIETLPPDDSSDAGDGGNSGGNAASNH